MQNLIPRFAVTGLNQWFKQSHRKPLILRGARQVGKSTLVREFAREQGLILHEVNLEKHAWLDEQFKTLDIKKILSNLEVLLNSKIVPGKSLLFLDEIQATPWAIAALRYFYEEFPKLPVIAAESLLEFTLSKHSFSMPVGRVEYFHISPLTFGEFIQAKGEKMLLEIFFNYKFGEEISEAAHLKFCQYLREYFYLGGMPAVVAEHIHSSESMLEARKTQDSILETYQDDFAKYATHKQLQLLQSVFKQTALQVGRKLKYNKISADHKAAEIKTAIELLTKAKIITPVLHSDCSGIPLGAGTKQNVCKLLFLDIGLLNRILGLDWTQISTHLSNIKLVNEGVLAEQFVGQSLLASQNHTGDRSELYYWLREGKLGNAEVDFVLASGLNIIPVEVKAGKAGSLKSLFQFFTDKSPCFGIRLDLNLPSTQKKPIKLFSLPLYLAERLPALLE